MIILLRHGQTEVNAGGRLQGHLDAPLTELGRRQAAGAAASLLVRSPGLRLVTSPLLRASQTAEAFGPNVEVEVDERWIELDYGEWDGRPLASIPPEVWDGWRTDPAFAPPGGESLLHLSDRVHAACADLSTQDGDGDVVVISHVSPIKAAVAWALGVGPTVSWRTFLGVASISRIAIGPKGPSLHSFNEDCHLGQVPSAS